MRFPSTTDKHPLPSTIHKLLGKIDRLQLPTRSRRDVECILVRQAARELDRAFLSHTGHGCRTAEIAVQIGRHVRLTNDELHHLKLASYLHDIGMLLLPHGLTECGGYLDSQVDRTVQNHARLGASLLEPFTFLQSASVLIAHHHERWDGTGYPYGIRGPFIPLGARILSVADAFDAIKVPGTRDRQARDLIAARIIRVAAGTQFDPAVVAALTEVLTRAAPAISGERTDE